MTSQRLQSRLLSHTSACQASSATWQPASVSVAELVHATCKAEAETKKGCGTTTVTLQDHKPRYMHNE